VLALNPAGLILVTTLGSTASSHPAPFVAAVECCTRHADVGVVVLCPDPPTAHPALDRLRVGARRVEGAAVPAVPVSGERTPPIWLPPITGRPHPQSLIEQRMAAALARDAELAPLFAFNRTIRTVRGSLPRVDLVWAEGRLVVELDGAEHSACPKYMADRHRDYELALTGYTVLRIANDEAAIDIGRALEKIRDMVRFRRAEMTRRSGA
jgi:very-short-patch-repair endonuclease